MEGNYLSMIAPRVLLLQVLSENVEKLQSDIGQQKWASFCSGLVAALKAMRAEVLQGLPHDSELKKVVKHVFEKKYNVVVLGEQIREHYTKTKDSGDVALAVKTALALFVQAIDKHLLAFLHVNPYEGSLLALLSGSDLPRRASTWGSFLDTYSLVVMPAPQQFDFLATGLVLNESLIKCLHDAQGATTTSAKALITTDRVFFVTDRALVKPRIEHGGSFEDLSYGAVKVGFNDVGGTIPTPIEEVVFIERTNFMEKDYTSFIESINSHLALLDEEAGNSSPTADVLLYVHGYMTKFGEGDIRRAAQIKHDMNLFGTTIAYSWSSQQRSGILEGYWADERAVAATTPYLASFIKLCITQVKARRLHILAHSMGNRAMIGALWQIYAEITSGGDDEWIRTGLPLKNVISAAADWTMSQFQGMVAEAKQIFGEENGRPHFSVYSSMDDSALKVSNALHSDEGIRLGLTDAHFQDDSVTLSEPRESGFIDVIDATGYKNSIHMYFATEADVLRDMQQLLSIPGKERAYLRASSDGSLISNVQYATTDKEFKFYSFSPATWVIS